MKKTILFLVFSIVSLFFPATAVAGDAKIDNIKVAYIYNFIRYINWPESNTKKDVFHICVHKDSDLQEKLLKLESKTVKSKNIKIFSISGAGKELSKCEVLVLPKLKQAELKEFTTYASPSNILTISDTQGYARLDVMINLVVLDNKIRFEVNLNEVDSAALTISSNLLKLAKIVESEDKK